MKFRVILKKLTKKTLKRLTTTIFKAFKKRSKHLRIMIGKMRIMINLNLNLKSRRMVKIYLRLVLCNNKPKFKTKNKLSQSCSKLMIN